MRDDERKNRTTTPAGRGPDPTLGGGQQMHPGYSGAYPVSSLTHLLSVSTSLTCAIVDGHVAAPPRTEARSRQPRRSSRIPADPAVNSGITAVSKRLCSQQNHAGEGLRQGKASHSRAIDKGGRNPADKIVNSGDHDRHG